jgi:hypothetical protein
MWQWTIDEISWIDQSLKLICSTAGCSPVLHSYRLGFFFNNLCLALLALDAHMRWYFWLYHSILLPKMSTFHYVTIHGFCQNNVPLAMTDHVADHACKCVLWKYQKQLRSHWINDPGKTDFHSSACQHWDLLAFWCSFFFERTILMLSSTAVYKEENYGNIKHALVFECIQHLDLVLCPDTCKTPWLFLA